MTVSFALSPDHPPAGFAARVDALASLLGRAAQLRPCVLASSLSVEDNVLMHAISAAALPIEVVALDTLKLPPATHALAAEMERATGLRIRWLRPATESLIALAGSHRFEAIYHSRAARERCCTTRKVEVLAAELAGKAAWVTGLRRAHSAGREVIETEHWDTRFALRKFNPLAAWSDEDVWWYTRVHGLPFNRLYERGYASIGCEPCTRAIRPGEHPRAGRWWWEQDRPQGGECGLHVLPPTAAESAGVPA